MSEPLDEPYLKWLYEQVADPDLQDQSLTFWEVLRLLYKTEFVWVVPNDMNRIVDGKALRDEFVNSQGLSNVDPHWMDLGCSVLELMVGLSRRMEFEADGTPHYWFWILMENLGLERYTDDIDLPSEDIEDVLDRLIYRQYEPDGLGGFFPLRMPRKNQLTQEIWNQMNDYLLERGLAG